MTRPYTNSVIEFNPNDLNYIAWTQIRLITTRFFPLKHSYTLQRRHIWICTSERASCIASWKTKFDRVEVTSSLYISTKFWLCHGKEIDLEDYFKALGRTGLNKYIVLFSGPSTHQLLLQRIRRTFSHLPERYQFADTSEKQKERN